MIVGWTSQSWLHNLSSFTYLLLSLLSGSGNRCKSGKLSYEELGVAKLSGFCDWLSLHPLLAESDGVEDLDLHPSSQRMIIFAHHHMVLDGIQVWFFLSWWFLFTFLKWPESTFYYCSFERYWDILLKSWRLTRSQIIFYPLILLSLSHLCPMCSQTRSMTT